MKQWNEDLQKARAGDLRNMVRAARLYAEKRAAKLYAKKSDDKKENKNLQQMVADEMGTTQGTVSRWLQRAEEIGIVEKHVVPPPLIRAEETLRKRLPSLSEAYVVPNGDGKNLENLGYRGAEVLAACLWGLKNKRKISITLSCGETLHSVLKSFFSSILRFDTELQEMLQEKELHIFPATLYADYLLRPHYPIAIVAMFDILSVGFLSEKNVYTYTPQLPKESYKWSSRKRADFCKNYGITEIVSQAKNADIFITGIGVASSETYSSIAKHLDLELPKNCDLSEVAEIHYIPLQKDGKPYPEFNKKVVGVTVSDMRDAYDDNEKTVIAVAGGDKRKLLPRLTHQNYFNVLVTDEGMVDALGR